MHLDDAGLLVLADLEAHGHHRVTVAGHGVDVLDAAQRLHAPLDGTREEILDLDGARAGHRRDDVDHGDRDLRLLLPRRGGDAERAERERRDDDQRREFGLEEGAGDATGNSHGQEPFPAGTST